MKTSDYHRRTNALRDAIAAEAGKTEPWPSGWGMPAWPGNFAHSMAALRSASYEIVVCGEVKRGKSTLVNAVVGRELLPTGVRETTSQVFRISANDRESCALVFEGGDREEISADELRRYGSQTAVELEGMPLFRGRALRWIEVNTPASFLPPGVHLVDTPGLGALYAAHSEITNRYVTQADAVVFVLDSGQPLTQPEKEFLGKCLQITPHILFVQTKIDTKSEEEWRKILQRNEELLNTAFHKGGRPRIRVYPVNSKALAQSAGEQDATERQYLLEDSRFEAFRRALEIVMFRATGWTRCAWVVAEATRYADSCRQTLEEQLRVLTAESAGEKDELRRKKTEIRLAFQKQWGVGGGKRTQFIGEVTRILQGVRNAAQYIGATGTEFMSRLTGEINALASVEVIDAYARNLPENVQNGVNKEWQEIIAQAQHQIARLDENLPMIPEDLSPIHVDLPRISIRQPSLWDRVKNTNIDGMVGGSLAALVAGFFLTGGIATAAIAVGTLLGASRGFSRIVNQQLESAKSELRQHMANLVAQCRNALCAPDMRHGNPISKVDAFIEETQARVKKTLEEQYGVHKLRMEQQEQTLEEQSRLTGEQRKEEMEAIRTRLKEVGQVQDKLKELVQELRNIQAELDKAEAE